MTENETKTIIIQGPSPTLGIVGFVFGVISIFALSIIFVPIAIIFAISSFFKEEQQIWAILALICAIIGTVTSPILLLLLAGLWDYLSNDLYRDIRYFFYILFN